MLSRCQTIDELINYDGITGLNVFPQGTSSCDHYDMSTTFLLQSPDVHLIINF